MIYVQFEMGEVVKKELGVFEQVGVAFKIGRNSFLGLVWRVGGEKRVGGWRFYKEIRKEKRDCVTFF